MIYRELGRSGVRVSALGLGGHEYLPDGRLRGFQEDFALALTPGHVFPGFGGPARQRVLGLAWDHGINFFDVTQDSEKEALGRNLRETPPPFEVVVQTRPEQMMYDRDPGNGKMADYPTLRAEVQRICRLMRRDRIDVLNLGIVPDAWRGDPEYLPRLRDVTARLKRDGLVRLTSADTFRGEATYLAMIASGGFDTVFVNLNPADDAALGRVLPAARAAGLGVVGREAFMKGELFRMGAEVGLHDRARLARAALRWVLDVARPTTIVVGAATPEHLAGSLAALESPAPGDDDQAVLAALRASPLFRAFAAQRHREFLEEAPPARI
jgi:aryl-alcohol dehydrogenase-like predicted oxidoreductase